MSVYTDLYSIILIIERHVKSFHVYLSAGSGTFDRVSSRVFFKAVMATMTSDRSPDVGDRRSKISLSGVRNQGDSAYLVSRQNFPRSSGGAMAYWPV